MFNPVSTYRIQFHKGFTFTHLENIIPYLVNLGVKTLYASPIFKAVPGSNHGYDGLDPLSINPEIGTLEQLKNISTQLRENGISWLQDIVPNHMAFDWRNAWLTDVLEKGPLSAYSGYFDQSLASELFKGPIMVPFLGDDLASIINDDQLELEWNQDKLVFRYAEQAWPLNLRSYTQVLQNSGAAQTDAARQLLQQIDEANQITEASAFSPAMDEIRLQLVSLTKNEAFDKYLQTCISNVNADKELLRELAEKQYYRLCNWKETDHQINFRRFFTVNGLICLNIQRREVFERVHELVNTLLKEDIIQGLRIDHIDGLYDPARYLQLLREMAGEDTYIVVEKILEEGEELPADWPIQGTTGYDFLAQVNNLFTNRDSEKTFTRFYTKLTGNSKSVTEQIHEKKALILSSHMNGELENLTRLFTESDLSAGANIHAYEIKQAIAAFLIEFPVYRFYGNDFPLDEKETTALAHIFKKVKKHKPELSGTIDLLQDVLLQKPLENNEAYNKKVLHFYQRCMQLTGPLMAKGVEDTLMYTYNRFIDHNEVGDSPDAFGLSAKEFHKLMQQRQQQWPLAMNATATHDTKRGEGVRARLNVLTNMADEWLEMVTQWQELNKQLKSAGAPDDNDEYFIYQTLVGAYPMPGHDEDNFAERLEAYLEKMLREAKRHTNWAEPNEAYENGVKQFAAALLDKTGPFWESFSGFHQKVSDFGIVNTLAQTILKLTCPGVPDIYQGCEHWDLSMVDPDNRRPVDFELRQQLLNTAEEQAGSLWNNRTNGQIKVWLVSKLLKLRGQYPTLFCEGEYLPLSIKGEYKDALMAFARVYEGNWMVVIIPVNLLAVNNAELQNPADINWGNTRVVLPGNAPLNWENILTATNGVHQKEISLADVLQDFPFAVLRLTKGDNERSAGILMHITSLPSLFGVGDFGPQATHFANLLNRCYQQYWQILPMNATGAADAYSPYSSYSSQAGNTLLISPELLAEEGLLYKEELKLAYVTETNHADFKTVEKQKDELFEKAWLNFNNNPNIHQQADFEAFCQKETYWLNDYALFIVLKQQQNNDPWYNWPLEYKLRDEKALAAFVKRNENALNKVKWLQFVFAKQWLDLKAYCNALNIKLFGDLPFYISYNSADVWANREVFSLNENAELIKICGVPPDYFNENGQRWGMPVFNWEVLEKTSYDWWIKRIAKNLEWYDLLRLDHFRAFAAYWEIPASEETAINGQWVNGPGSKFFKALQTHFGKLPFVAEDLGDIDAPVYALRDEFNFPGMKVLQFAFGDDMPYSAYIPHHHSENHFVYTGTHDNNTTLGWFLNDADAAVPKNLKKYTGIRVTGKNVNKVLIKTALASVCKTAIIPVQDWLNLDEKARMNTPASATKNWTWRLTSEQLANFPEKRIKKWTILFDRV